MKDGRTMENCLFCDLETPEEFIEFFESHRAHETGVIAKALCPDIAKLYRRNMELEAQVEEYKKDYSELFGELLKWQSGEYRP